MKAYSDNLRLSIFDDSFASLICYANDQLDRDIDLLISPLLEGTDNTDPPIHNSYRLHSHNYSSIADRPTASRLTETAPPLPANILLSNENFGPADLSFRGTF